MSSNKVSANIIDAFDLAASGYDKSALRYFVFCADFLIDWINVQPGQKLLDIACGTGAVSLAASQHVSPGGRVHGIDLSEQMLAQAEKNINKMKLDNIDLHCMDASDPEFKSKYFDAAVCSFGLFFLEDLPTVLRNWLRVLKPGGTLAFTSFTQNAFMPQMKLLAERLIAMGVEIAENQAFQLLQSESNCHQLLQALPVEQIVTETRQFGINLESFEEWWTVVWNSGFRYYLSQLDEQAIAKLRDLHYDEITALKTDQGIWLDVEVILSKARKL